MTGDVFPAIRTSKTRAEAWLVVPDLQAPFQAKRALEFCLAVRKEYGIHRDQPVLFTGDEVDNYHGKGFDRLDDPDHGDTPNQELARAVDELKRWYAAFPVARLARSNHGTRYERRAAEAGIASAWMRGYTEVIEAPPRWQWADTWLVRGSKHHFMLEHGHQGESDTQAKVLSNGYSTVHGHFTQAKWCRLSNRHGRRLWGFCAAALIDTEAYAFKYAKAYPKKADNGCGVILDGGNSPVWIPYEAV